MIKYFKKITIIMLLFFLAVPGFSYGQQVNSLPLKKVTAVAEKNDPTSFNITTPDKINSITTSPKIVLSGVANPGDKIIISTHSLSYKAGKEIVSTPLEDFEIVVDSLGIFAQELNLSKGDNEIHITLVRGTEYKYLYTVNYTEDISKTLNNKVRSTDTKDII